jgi:glycosyltransferase involved in cell wall biosynthesis
MKVVVTMAALDPQHGGPAQTVPALCRALARSGTSVELITIGEHGQSSPAVDVDGFTSILIPTQADRYHPRSWRGTFKNSVTRALTARMGAVLYDVGLWLPSNHFAAQIAERTKTPFVSSPRGMLSRQALQVSKWKKRLAWVFYQKSDLRSACVLHATSQQEAEDLCRSNLSQPIAIIPNGVDLLSSTARLSTTKREHRTLLFLSRLHPMKGLNDLVRAWASVRPPNWRVVIAGPDEKEHRAEVEALSESLNVRSSFEFVGPVDEEAKWDLFANADLFVLPSYSESFGLVIAEAMAAALPVITTRATPWREVETNNCGWWIDNGAEPLAHALTAATRCSAGELAGMGRRGRALVEKNYSWETAAQKMLAMFEWIIGEGEQPAWLI